MKIFLFTILINFICTDTLDNIHSVVEQLESISKRNLKGKKLDDDDMDLDILNSEVDAEQAAGYDESHVQNALQMVEENNEVSETSFSGYPLIMTIGERIIKRPKIEDIVEQQRHYKQEYKVTRDMMLSIVNNNEELVEQVHNFMNNLDHLELTSEDLVKFFGFEDFFNEIKSRIRTDNIEFDENMQSLNLFTNSVTEDLVNFFKGLFRFYNIGDFLKSLISDKRNVVDSDNKKQYEKIDQSLELMKGVLDAKKQMTDRLITIEDIIQRKSRVINVRFRRCRRITQVRIIGAR